jgi:hypothetical protein
LRSDERQRDRAEGREISEATALPNFIELHYDSTGNAVTINVDKIISYERVPGRSYTDLLTERENVTVRETPLEISQLIMAAQGRTS